MIVTLQIPEDMMLTDLAVHINNTSWIITDNWLEFDEVKVRMLQ